MASPASLAPPRADIAGLTLADLLDRAPPQPAIMPYAFGVALADEVEWGRVVLDGDRYRLVVSSFDGDVLAALRALVL
jgi:hypothetical protein